MKTLLDYQDYLEDVAIRHPGLPHITAPGSKFVSVAGPLDLYKELKSRLNVSEWCVLIDKPEPRTAPNDSRQFFAYHRAAIELFKKYSSTDPAVVSALQSEAYALLSQVVARMLWQHEKRRFPLGFLETTFPMPYLEMKDEFLAGCRLEFTYYQKADSACSHVPSAWGD